MVNRKLLVTLILLVGMAGMAGAQEAPKAEISLGYAFLNDDSLGDFDISGNFPLGWMASANFNVSNWLGVVLDISGSYKSEDLILDDLKLNVHGFHGGLRFSSYKNSSATPYFQALAGVTRGAADFLGESDSATDFSIQPGAGVIVRLSDSIGIDLGADYRLVFSEGDKTNEFRVHGGVVFRIGR